MGITPLTKDSSPIALTFPTMLGQEEFCQLGYYLIDRVARHLYQVRLCAPYRRVSEETRQVLELLPLPDNGVTAEEIVAFFEERIQPYPTFGIGHPRGFGWIAGGPDPMAVLGSLLAAALNPNCIGGDQSATYLELAVLRWLKKLVGFPTEGSAGLLLSGGTQATLVCLMVARHAAAVRAGWNPRTEGLQRYPTPLVLYASEQTHHCVAGAVEVLGLGQHHLRSIASTDDYQLDLAALHAAVRRDREDGLQPFCVVANAGTTNTGAIDPLAAIADFCEREGLWFHVDGSYGAFGRLDPRVASRYCGMERADSLTLDPHKWLSVPYECGCALLRTREQLVATFAVPPPDYLRETLGEVRFTDYSMQLSRGFHALKLWMALMSAGRSGLVALVSQHNALARRLATLIDSAPDLERMAPMELSTVCFRAVPAQLRCDDAALDALNQAVMREVQLEGEAFLSGTTLQGCFVLRACVLHSMTTEEDIMALVGSVQRAVRRLGSGRTCITRAGTHQGMIEGDIRRGEQ
jgi:aromatic-L-amino-acid/L-tryptophan decarboxylase